MTPRPRVLLDARPLTHPQAGGFRSYVRALLRGLAERGTDDLDLILCVDRPPDAAARALLPPGAAVRVLSPDRLRTDLRLFGAQVRADRPDLVHGTTNYLPRLPAGVPATVTIHDAFGVKRYPWDAGVPRTPRERFVNRYWAWRTRAAARAARRVVTDSRGAAAELRDALRLPPGKLAVVYPAPAALPLPRRAPGEERDASVLAVASPDPRKNVSLLYRALREGAGAFPGGGRAPRLDLVCTGEAAARRAEDALRYNGLTDFRLLRGVDDPALGRLYAAAGAFAWPSRGEGFGLPPVEAMAAGCPVASSRAPAMPEILGDEAPVYFDPGDAAGLAAALARLLSEDAEARRARAAAGRERAARYTCRRLADETVAVWKSALGGVGAVRAVGELGEFLKHERP